MAVGRAVDQEAAAADIAGLRMHYGEREADRHRRVDRVAAAAQHLDADRAGERVVRDDHRVAAGRGLGRPREPPPGREGSGPGGRQSGPGGAAPGGQQGQQQRPASWHGTYASRGADTAPALTRAPARGARTGARPMMRFPIAVHRLVPLLAASAAALAAPAAAQASPLNYICYRAAARRGSTARSTTPPGAPPPGREAFVDIEGDREAGAALPHPDEDAVGRPLPVRRRRARGAARLGARSPSATP